MVGGEQYSKKEPVFIMSVESSAPTQNAQSVINSHVARLAGDQRREANKRGVLQHLQDALELQQDGDFQAPSWSSHRPSKRSSAKKPNPVPLRPKENPQDITRATQLSGLGRKSLRRLVSSHAERLQLDRPGLLSMCRCIICSHAASMGSPDAFNIPRPSRSPSPPPWIGGVDPFNDFPIVLDYHGRLLLRHYQFGIPSALFGIQRVDSFSIHKNIYFPIALREKLWFLQMLAFASLHRDRKLGLLHDSLDTSRYLGAAVQAINQCISDQRTRYGSSVAGAVSSAAYIEYANGRTEAFETHVRGLSQILKARRRSEGQVDHDIDAVILTHLLCFCKGHVAMAQSAWIHDNPLALAEAQEMLAGANASIRLLERIAVWNRERRGKSSYSRASSLDSLLRLQQLIVYAPTSVLTRLLREPQRLRIPDVGVAVHEEAHRLFALFYLVLVAWELENDADRHLGFLSDLRTLLIEHHVTDYTASRLVWILLRCVGNDTPDRRWRALKLVRTLFMLSANAKEVVSGFLLTVIGDVGRGVRTDFNLDLGDVKSEVDFIEDMILGRCKAG